MHGLNLQQIADWSAGHLVRENDVFSGIAHADSRLLNAGDLFVALPGANVDGHDFLLGADAAGASVAIVERIPEGDFRMAFIEVADSLMALHSLARNYCHNLNAQVVGITGSVGKTSAKDMLATLLGGVAENIHAAPASFNSEIGLPLAILAAPLDTKIMVLEYGINEPGEMEVLIDIATPDLAWLTAISAAHLEGMKSLRNIAAEKSLLCWSATTGIWSSRELAGIAAANGEMWGMRAHLCSEQDEGRSLTTELPGDFVGHLPEIGEVQTSFMAKHQWEAFMVAVSLASHLGVTKEQLRQRTRDLQSPRGRMELIEMGGIRILDDAYNASPSSMRAAFNCIEAMDCSGKRIAILGTMHELGDESAQMHKELGCLLNDYSFDCVIGIGIGGQQILDSVATENTNLSTHSFARIEDLNDLVMLEIVQPNNLVLLKASRSEKLELLIPRLEKHSALIEVAL